jgi:hypothetical protein
VHVKLNLFYITVCARGFTNRTGYPEGHISVIKKVEDTSKLSESENSRLVTLPEGTFVCSDEVGACCCVRSYFTMLTARI